MTRSIITSSALVGAIVVFMSGLQPAVAQSPSTTPSPIKAAMGENFGGLQSILYALISADYSAVPGQADMIRQHAADLVRMVPDSAKAEREKFLTYASSLGAHAKDMKSIALLLSKRDHERMESSTDHLREALAGHYGGMVTMCVACHNRFRPLPVE